MLAADGVASATNCSNGGGAGGSLFVWADAIVTAGTPVISANGGNGTIDACGCPGTIGGGGGAGGRIALFARSTALDPSVASVRGGPSNGGGGVGAGGVLFFRPGANTLVTLTAPADGGPGAVAGTTLRWTAPPGVDHVHVEIDDDDRFTDTTNHPDTGELPIAIGIEMTGVPGGPLTGSTWTTPPLRPGTTYHWHVVAHDAANQIVAASPIWTFRTP